MMFRSRAFDNLNYLFDSEFKIVYNYDLTLRLAYRCKTDYLNECLAK